MSADALRDRLLGTWRLVGEELRELSGARSGRQRPPSRGFITYTDDGFVFWARADIDRPKIAGGDLAQATLEEKAKAAESFRGYVARFRVEGSRVVHDVEISLFPNWSGTRLERELRFEGSILELISQPFREGGREVVGVLRFEPATRESP